MVNVTLPTADEEELSEEVSAFIRNQTEQHDYDGAVIGLSGGVDSSTVAVLARKAYDNSDKNLLGVSLPAEENDEESTELAEELSGKFGFQHRTIRVDAVRDSFTHSLGVDLSDFDRGNMTARIRANILNTLSAHHNYIVLGTGNADEARIGYYTMFGDGAVHCHPIGQVPKRIVYDLAEHLDIPDRIIDRPPTDGLQEDKTDETDLGYPYSDVELVIEALYQGVDPKALKDEEEWEETVSDIISRHDVATNKSDIISPPLASVPLNYDHE